MKKEGYLILSGKVRWQTVLYFLQTITGLFLTSFLFVHFLGVSTVWGGSRWFNWYTAHLDKNNFFIKAAVFLIFGIFLAHAANGFKIIWGYFLKTLKVYKYLADMNPVEAMEFLRDRMLQTETNEEFLVSMNSN